MSVYIDTVTDLDENCDVCGAEATWNAYETLRPLCDDCSNRDESYDYVEIIPEL